MPRHDPNNAPASGSDAFFSGVFSWPLANQPYQKNFGILVCPSDSDKGGWGKTVGAANSPSACYRDQLVQFGVPGASPMMTTADMIKALPLSYAGNYYLDAIYRGGTYGMASTTSIARPSNVFFVADVGSNKQADGNPFASWYLIPGYGLSATDKRWENGQRHTQGRNWAFTDGHAKFTRDPGFKRADGTLKSAAEVQSDYNGLGIFFDPNRDQ